MSNVWDDDKDVSGLSEYFKITIKFLLPCSINTILLVSNRAAWCDQKSHSRVYDSTGAPPIL